MRVEQHRVVVGVADSMGVVPIAPRIHIDNLADPPRAHSFNQADVILQKPQHMARHDEARGAACGGKERDGGARRRRNYRVDQSQGVG